MSVIIYLLILGATFPFSDLYQMYLNISYRKSNNFSVCRAFWYSYDTRPGISDYGDGSIEGRKNLREISTCKSQ